MTASMTASMSAAALSAEMWCFVARHPLPVACGITTSKSMNSEGLLTSGQGRSWGTGPTAINNGATCHDREHEVSSFAVLNLLRDSKYCGRVIIGFISRLRAIF